MDKKVTIYEPDNSIKKGYCSLFVEIVDEIIRNRWLIYQFFKRDFIAIYKQTFFGILWTIFPPLISVCVFIFLHRAGILNIGDITVPYPLYAIIGMSYWQLFSTTIIASSNVLVNAGPMVVKINFSKKSLIIASAGQALFSYFVQFALLIGIFLYYNLYPHYSIIFTPIFILPFIFLALGLGFLLSVFHGISREIGSAIPLFLTFFLFVTPVFYERPFQGIISLLTNYNPLYYLIVLPRDMIINGKSILWTGYIYSCFFTIFVFLLCVTIFHLVETKISERI